MSTSEMTPSTFPHPRPTTTATPGLLVALTAVAFSAGCAEPAEAPARAATQPFRSVVETDGAPPAVGPYSQAIRVGNTLYLAGQIGMDPETGEIVEGGVVEETHQVLRNLGAVLEAGGFTFDDVVQAQVFLADVDDFQAMNEVYASYFGGSPPARATIQAGRIPLDARVEIMLTAVRNPQ